MPGSGFYLCCCPLGPIAKIGSPPRIRRNEVQVEWGSRGQSGIRNKLGRRCPRGIVPPVSVKEKRRKMVRSDLLVQIFATFLSVVGFCSPSVAAGATSIGKIRHIVVIYAENRSFDNLYGMFPGANGIANALANYLPQVDHDGTPLKALPPVWANEGDLKSRETDPTYPATLPNRPFRIDRPPVNRLLDV